MVGEFAGGLAPEPGPQPLPFPAAVPIPTVDDSIGSSSRSGHRRSLDNSEALSKANRMPDEDEDETLSEKGVMDRQNDDPEGEDGDPNRPSDSPAAAATTSRKRPRSSDQLPAQKALSPSNLPRSSQWQLQPPLHIYPHFHPAFNNPGSLSTLVTAPLTRQK
ncbi:hypothetical protein VKT23_015288 [Stygiomarasmius scandens]|uniref:Uncharacterized protein n=1 Tax=Marasmiellus scandens TaxID=2682957 RepID=A0ABR1J0G1_9AGAR